jgi:glycosyltransferase involved in cell wall biosynthesis
MPAPAPLISLIIVCRNPGAKLVTALKSVWAQASPPSIEIIIIDGASTDGTPAWLEKNAARIHHWSSTPDDGIYDAMNRGVAVSTGDWVYFLGADDQLATPNLFAQVAPFLASATDSIASGTAQFSDGRTYSCTGDATAIRRNYLHHQATFYRRALFDQFGIFDTTLRLQADYEFNLRLLRANQSITTLPLLIAHCSSGGLSDAGQWLNYREEITVRHRHFGLWTSPLWDAVTLLRYFRKIIVRIRAKNLPA